MITDENPKGEKRIVQTNEFIILVGKSSWFNEGDRVFIPNVELYQRVRRAPMKVQGKDRNVKNIKGDDEMVDNPYFVPPFYLTEPPKEGDPYVMLLRPEQIEEAIFKYGK